MKYILLFSLFFSQSFSLTAQTWKELNTQVVELYNNGEYEKAIPIAIKAIEAVKAQLGESHPQYFNALNNLVAFYQALGQYEKAEPICLQSVDITRKVLGEVHLTHAASLNMLAILYQNMGLYQKAEPLYIKVIEIRKKLVGEKDYDYGAALNNLATLYQTMGYYEKAELLFIKASEIWKVLLGESDPDYATSLNNIALLYQSMGQYEKAEALYIKSLAISKKINGENQSYAIDINNLAALYQDMGQYDKAEPLYIQAREIYLRVLGENHADYGTSINNLALLYQDLGQYEKATPLFIRAAQIAKKVLGEKHPTFAESLNNIGVIYQKRGLYEKAEPIHLTAIEIGKKALGESHPSYATHLNNLASLYTSLGQYSKAEPLLLLALKTNKKNLGETHPRYALYLNNLALLYESQGEYKKAEPLYIQAIAIFKNSLGETHPSYMSALNSLARLYGGMGLYEKSEPLMIQSNVIALQNLRTNFIILSEKEKANYITNNISLIENNNSLLFNNKKSSPNVIQNNLSLQLIFKSLTLADTKKMLALVQQSSDTAIKRMMKEWQQSKNILAKQYSLPITNRRSDLKQIEINSENLEKELVRKSSTFANQQNNISSSLKNLQKGLQQNEVAIEFVSFRLYNKRWTDSTIYAAYIINKSDSVPVFVPLCEEKQLQTLFDSAGNTATIMVSNLYRGLKTEQMKTALLGKELYRLIWQPLEPYLKGVKKISYSPAGKLYSIAFHALLIDSTTVLMDKYQLQQYTSTRQVALRNAENQTTKPGSITLFGNASFTMDSLQLTKEKRNQPEKVYISTSIYSPQKRSGDNNTWSILPGTAEEVKKIKQLFDQNKITTQSFVQTTASEENLKALSGKSPQILHIATHGFFLPEADKKRKENNFNNENTYTLADDPLLRSGLILSGGNYAWSGKTPIDGVEDGIATAYEISQLNLSNTELVVLSACETALGDVKGSEGVFGLQRAFKMAGVKKMIVSLWQVPDKETAELMTAFYSYWMKGKTINDAFAQAQADMRKKYSPFYWAAFVLVE